MQFHGRRWPLIFCACVLAAGLAVSDETVKKDTAVKIPVTTSSDEARAVYAKGRDLAEKLRATDARALYEQAAAKDKTFALAHLGLATTAGTAKEFFDALDRAVQAAGKASEAERLMVLGVEAGAKGQVEAQREHYTKLTEAFPNDERAHTLLGNHFFGQQDWASAVAHYEKAIAIAPAYSPPYNQMGYAHRALARYPEAEKAFRKYIELIPDDPNPYDSYAELLMKTGRFDESIQNYEKALAIDPNFIASYVGIGNNQVFLGRGEDARKTFARLSARARNNGERRQAHLWTAISWTHENAPEKAVAEIEKMRALAEADKDYASASGDLNFIGDVLLEAGRPDEALVKYRETVAVIEKAQVPAEVKEAARRNLLYDEGRVALAKKDLPAAKAKGESFARAVSAKAIPNEVRLQHELAGRIALEEKDHAKAVTELQQANQQDPRALYLLAVALHAKGDAPRAREVAERAAAFNGLSLTYGYVKKKAAELSKG
jgi:tetratricopeptide (TPR) repeat protein